MTGLPQFSSNGLVPVKFSVDDDPDPPILIGDGLVSGQQVNDAEPCVPESNPPVLRNPMPLPIRSAVVKSLNGALYSRF